MATENSSLQKVEKALKERGIQTQILELPQSTATAGQAAQAVGCQIGQIAKSLVFKTKNTGSRPSRASPWARAILVVASGANRVDEGKLAALVGEPIEKADADFVRQETGFAIGGVPPVGHPKPLETYLDEDLLQHQEIWAAAGTPHAVFKLTPPELREITKGKVTTIKA